MSVLRFRQPVSTSSGGKSVQPYLVERLMAAVYRRENLPVFIGRGEMIRIAEKRSSTTGRRVCLVLGVGKCIYFEPDGRRTWAEDAPSGGVGIGRPGPD